MRSILEELWYGNVCPNNGCREATKEAKELMGYIADHHDNLLATLTDSPTLYPKHPLQGE